MKKNKKGFTLIELLAVLVVLAILALISVPIVLNIIEQSRQKARLRSMEGYAKAVESALYVYQMENPTVQSWKLFNDNSGKSYIVAGSVTERGANVPEREVSYSGSTVVCGTRTVSNNTTTIANDGLTVTDNNGIELKNCTIDGNNNNNNYYHYYDAQGKDTAKQ